jgi:hypothetical protein
MYAIVGAYTLLATSVAGMAITMYLNSDPNASVANVVVSGVVAAVMATLTGYLYRPLLHGSARPTTAPSAPAIAGSLSGDQRTTTPTP